MYQHIVPPCPPQYRPDAPPDPYWDPFGSNQKAETCRACPYLNDACNLRGFRAPIEEAGYNIVFLLSKADLDSVETDTDVSARTWRLLDQICERVNRRLRLTKRLVFSVIYASAYPAENAPLAKGIARCRSFVNQKLVRLAHINASVWGKNARPNVVVAFGRAAWDCLELPGKEHEILAEEHVTNLGPAATYHIIAAHSLEMLRVKDGYLDAVVGRVLRAAQAVFSTFTPVSVDALTQKMRFPRTADELAQVVDEILAYSVSPTLPAIKSPVAVDIESTGLLMWDPRERVISFAAAWDRDPREGRAAAWLLDHRDADPAQIDGMWRETMRLLHSGKALILHNGKFDLGALLGRRGFDPSRVNFADDTMCRAHFVAENARGSYGLKNQIWLYCPDMGGYEGQLHQQMQRTIEAELANASKWVDYTTSTAAGVDVTRVPDLPGLEEQYVKVCLRSRVTKRTDNGWDALRKERTSLWNRIKTRYTKIGRDAPDRAVVNLHDLFTGSGAYETVPVETLLRYNALDCVATMLVYEGQTQALRDQDAYYNDASDLQSSAPPGSITLTDGVRIARRLYLPMSWAYAHMSYEGLRVDTQRLAAYRQQAAALQQEYLEKLTILVGRPVYPNKPKDIADILVNVLGVDPATLPLTPKGQVSTGADALEMLLATRGADRVALFAHLLLCFRAMRDTQGRYLDKIEAGIVRDGKLHPSYHLVGTKTGRSSASEPSMQNWPKLMGRRLWEILARKLSTPETEEGDTVLQIGSFTFRVPNRDILAAQHAGTKVCLDALAGFPLKALIIPPPGMAWWNVDIGSAEIRLATAYFPEGSALTEAIAKGRNIPSYVCAKAMGDRIRTAYGMPEADFETVYAFVHARKDTDPVLGEWRTAAKRTLYGAFYGAGVRTLATQIYEYLDPDPEVAATQIAFAQEVYDSLMSEFPELSTFIRDTHKWAERRLRVRSLFGRYRRFPLGKIDRKATGDMRRESVNFLIQSAANDVTFLAAAQMEKDVRQRGGRVVLTVHDAISGWWPKEDLATLYALAEADIRELVQREVPWLPVTWEFDMEVGTSYGEMVGLQRMLGKKMTIEKDGKKSLLIARKLGYPQPEDSLVEG